MSIRKVLQQVERLAPGHAYALVFNERLTQPELDNLKDLCQKVQLHAVILTGCRVVPLARIATLLGEVDEEELAKALLPAPPPPPEAPGTAPSSPVGMREGVNLGEDTPEQPPAPPDTAPGEVQNA